MDSSKWAGYLVVLLIGGGIGYVVHAPASNTAMNMNGDTMAAAASMDVHEERYDVPASQPKPTIAVQAFADPMSGWNLHIVTTNFIFDPEHAGSDAVAGHGHVHVMVDGVEVGRAYSNWYYMQALKPGQHTITIGLETNDHMDYYVGGVQVEASTTITQPSGTAVDTTNAKTFSLVVKGKKVVQGSGDITVTQGDTVVLTVTNDTDEELHLHGYNLMTDLKANVAGSISFQATASGRFPFELEGSKTDLGAISVEPK